MRIFARFVLSATDQRHFPAPALPEIAFLGRSNVGKSSVINSLVGSKIARTSSTPGRTRSINFFEIRRAGQPKPELMFVDLPGYGYAKISREVSAEWSSFVDPYLRERPTLALCLALVDSNIPPQASDRQLLEFLTSTHRPFVIVATKSDRLSGNELQRSLQTLRTEYGTATVIPFSVKNASAKDDIWRIIRQSLSGAPPFESPLPSDRSNIAI